MNHLYKATVITPCRIMAGGVRVSRHSARGRVWTGRDGLADENPQGLGQEVGTRHTSHAAGGGRGDRLGFYDEVINTR